MNIVEARDILANVIADEIIGTYCLNEAQKYNCNYCENDDCIYAKAIETVLNELDKKDKVIDMMAECIDGEPTFGYGHLRDINTPEKVKKYFYNKIGG